MYQNDDHSDAILYYTRFFGQKHHAQSAQLISMDSNGMKIRFNQRFQYGLSCQLDFDPPLTQVSEIRPRLIEMMNVAMKNLGLSIVRVDRYERPSSLVIGISILVGLVYFVQLTPLKRLPSILLPMKTDHLGLLFRISTIYIIPISHLIETVFILRPKLHHFRMSGRKRSYWYLSCVLAGYFSICQFDRLACKVMKEYDSKAKRRS